MHLQLGPLLLHVSHTRATSADVEMSQCPHIWDETHTTPHTHATHTYTHTQRHAAVNGLTPPLCRSNLSMPTLRVIFPGRGGREVLREPHVQCDGGGPPSESEGGHLAAAHKLILGTVAGFTAIAAHAMPHVPPDLLSWLWPSSEGTTVHSNMRPRSQANRVKLHTCSVAHRTILSGDDASPSSSGNGHSYSQ